MNKVANWHLGLTITFVVMWLPAMWAGYDGQLALLTMALLQYHFYEHEKGTADD